MESKNFDNQNEMKLREVLQIIGDIHPEFAEKVFSLSISLRKDYLLRTK